MEISETNLRTLLDMHAESVCRVEKVAKEELTKLTSYVRRIVDVEKRKAQVPRDT